MKKQNPAQNTTVALPTQKGSHSIAKMKPKVRIVHLPTPEIIEIEPADFQKYVQTLTGKSGGVNTKFKKPEFSSKEAPIILCEESSDTEVEIVNGVHSLECSDRRTTRDQEMTNCGYLEDGYLIGFEDLDKFIAELLDFPLLPSDWNDNQLA